MKLPSLDWGNLEGEGEGEGVGVAREGVEGARDGVLGAGVDGAEGVEATFLDASASTVNWMALAAGCVLK